MKWLRANTGVNTILLLLQFIITAFTTLLRHLVVVTFQEMSVQQRHLQLGFDGLTGTAIFFELFAGSLFCKFPLGE